MPQTSVILAVKAMEMAASGDYNDAKASDLFSAMASISLPCNGMCVKKNGGDCEECTRGSKAKGGCRQSRPGTGLAQLRDYQRRVRHRARRQR